MDEILYVLIGLPGSGKSRFAIEYLGATTPDGDGIVRINQDEMGRIGHRKIFQKMLDDRRCMVIDRVNFDRVQRERYILPARRAGYRIICIVFATPWNVCLGRIQERKGHPTISVDCDHSQIIDYFCSKMVLPTEDEYDELRTMSHV